MVYICLLKVTFRFNIRHLQTRYKIHYHAIFEYISLSIMLQSVKLQGTIRYDYASFFCSIALRENAFDTSVSVLLFSHIAGHHFAILINATSSHGRSQRFHFFAALPSERTLLTHKC